MIYIYFKITIYYIYPYILTYRNIYLNVHVCVLVCVTIIEKEPMNLEDLEEEYMEGIFGSRIGRRTIWLYYKN